MQDDPSRHDNDDEAPRLRRRGCRQMAVPALAVLYVSPPGAKSIDEVGIVSVAAALANAVYHSTAGRIRDLPITLDKFV